MRNSTVTESDTANGTKGCRMQWKGLRVTGQFGTYRGTEGKLADLIIACWISIETWDRP
jgi:hypothetical protein